MRRPAACRDDGVDRTEDAGHQAGRGADAVPVNQDVRGAPMYGAGRFVKGQCLLRTV